MRSRHCASIFSIALRKSGRRSKVPVALPLRLLHAVRTDMGREATHLSVLSCGFPVLSGFFTGALVDGKLANSALYTSRTMSPSRRFIVRLAIPLSGGGAQSVRFAGPPVTTASQVPPASTATSLAAALSAGLHRATVLKPLS